MSSASFRTSAAGGETNGSNPAVTITPAVGDLFVIFCNVKGNVNLTPTCSDNNASGGTYDLIFAVPKNASADTVSCFVRQNLLANTTSTTITVATGANTSGEVVVYAVSGMTLAGLAGIAQFGTQSNQAASTTPAPAVSQITAGTSMLLTVVGNGSNPAGVSAPAGSGWTRQQNVGQTGTGLVACYTNGSYQATSVTWGSTSATAFASGFIELFSGTTGVDVIKLNAYAVLGPQVGVNVTKLNAYAVLASLNNTPPIWGFSTFPDGVVSVPYSYSWDMPTSALTVTYTVSVGSLPPGLSLTALTGNQAKVSGTPTTAGTYNFTLHAVNAYGTADLATSITINPFSSVTGTAAYLFIQ